MPTYPVGVSLVALMLLVSAGCETGGSPTPTPPSPTVTSVSLSSSTDFLKVRETYTFTATAVHSDGSSATVTEWRSDTTGVATVDATTGKVTGVSAGTATIIATHDGTTATRLVRVAPDFAGTWKGEFKATTCTMSGDWSTGRAGWDVCDYDSNVGPAEFQFMQTRDQVTGIVTYSLLYENGRVRTTSGNISGTIDTSGHLKPAGVFTNPSDGATYTLTADGNDLYIPSDRLVGAFKVDLTKVTVTGRATTAFTTNGDGLTRVQ